MKDKTNNKVKIQISSKSNGQIVSKWAMQILSRRNSKIFFSPNANLTVFLLYVYGLYRTI